MSRFEYAFIRLNADLYLEDAMETLGAFFEICVYLLKMKPDDAVDLFLNSDLAGEFEWLSPKYVGGMAAGEMVLMALKKTGYSSALEQSLSSGNKEREFDLERIVGEACREADGISVDYWLGMMLAYFQCKTGCPYARIFAARTYEELRAIYYGHEEWSAEEMLPVFRGIVLEESPSSRLKAIREAAGLSQSRLSSLSGVSLRSIQQYEQGAKSINRAAAVSVLRLANALGCRVEDLIEWAEPDRKAP